MLPDLSLAFIGAGVMGEAMMRGLHTQQLVAPDAITASPPRQARLDELASLFGIQATTDNRTATAKADIVILCVKPQVLPGVLREMCGAIPGEAFVLSIVAGARLRTLAGGPGPPGAVRCMPNTPA